MAKDRARYRAALSRGHSHIWDQQWREAIEAFQAALELSADEPVPYAGLGDAYHGLGKPSEALDSYKQAARHSKGDVIYLRKVAEVQEQLGQGAEAGQTYMAIGEIQLRRGMVEDAVNNWSRAARLAPNLLRAHQRLAKYYTQQGQIRAAITAYLAVARLYQAQGDGRRALETCRAALNLDPRNADVLTAVDMIQQGEEIFSETEAGPVSELNTDLSETVDRMAPGYGENGSQGQNGVGPITDARRMAMEQLAEALFEEESESAGALLSKPERDALISQALDYQTRGMVDEAIETYEKVMEAGFRGVAAHFNLGLLYRDKLRFGQAIAQLERSVQDEGYRLASHFALGESYRARGQIERAMEHFITVLKMIDLQTVENERVDRLLELYDNLAESLRTSRDKEKTAEFANALVEFLTDEDWKRKVKDARKRLDALSEERMLILGDILTAGSAHVLESLHLSQEYVRREMLDTAVEEVYRAITISPDYLPAHIQLGELLVRQDRMEAAVNKFVTIADTFRVRGDDASAINMYERIVSVSPLDLGARTRLINMLKRRGQIDQSLEHYLAMGEAYYQLAQVDRARETYQEALKLAPQGSGEHHWRSKLLRRIADIDMQRFDWKRALAAYRELRREDPSDEQTAMTLIDLYYKMGQPTYAVRELDRYLKHLVGSGQAGKVLGVLEEMTQRYPTEPALVHRLARLQLARGRKKEAIDCLDRLGEALLEVGSTQEAIKTIEQIVQLDPDNVASYRQLLRQLRQN